ncbi:conserved protein of unknown function (plasmid) [Cupriavidus neocaledonicus]|uniref:Uncharacterized protein n=2 Tax=Cupriavidus neocaledonicus TaxID=1040979 RepID=A0A375HP30_9BURK|nr:conserved hypothetical protein [Cupriavidus neocaledonicus]SPD58604.1 conserved protein of unknown function [Cupriavidus neocaledonicus]
MHPAWAAVGEAAGEVPAKRNVCEAATADVAALLAEDSGLSDSARAAVSNLLRRHRLLEGELARQRTLLQEWILSQLTYKTLYYQYSGQSPQAPRVELMREKEAVRRRIRAQLQPGADYLAAPDEATRSLSSS